MATHPAAPPTLARWHAVVESRDPAGLAELLSDDVVFCSPAVHSPQEGRTATTAYLTAALAVLGPTLTYRRQWWDDTSAVLEFEATLDGRTVHGVDLLQWGPDHRLTEFTVMARPLRGLEMLMQKMGEQLATQLGGQG